MQSPTRSAGADLLEQLRACLSPELWEPVQKLGKRLQWAELRVQALEEKVRQRRIEKYGPGSESLCAAQLELLEREPGVSAAEVAAEAGREALPAGVPARGGERTHPGRQRLPERLQRLESVAACPPEAAVCSGCGGPTRVIGYDESERLEVRPAEYFVAVARREKRACGHWRRCRRRSSPRALPATPSWWRR